MDRVSRLKAAVANLPRLQLGHFPTPLEPLPRLSRALGGPTIWVKRDDCTGLAFGGNKTRHNEFIFAEAQRRGTTYVVWGATVQSNNCRQTAATCARLGLPVHLVLTTAHDPAGSECRIRPATGNLLVDYLLGATVEFVDVPLGPRFMKVLAEVAAEFEARGERVFALHQPVVNELATVSYVAAAAELLEQIRTYGLEFSAIYVASSGPTGAGLVAGLRYLGFQGRVRIIAPIIWPWAMDHHSAQLANLAFQRLGLPAEWTANDFDVDTRYVEPGYGVPSEAALEAIRLAARHDALLLDPVYTAKAFAALIGEVTEYGSGEQILFWHTGGQVAMFAYQELLTEHFACVGRPG